MERFPHLNPICSQHRRYSNADRNCPKPHPAGPAEEVREAVLGILENPARQRHLLHPVGNSLLSAECCLGKFTPFQNVLGNESRECPSLRRNKQVCSRGRQAASQTGACVLHLTDAFNPIECNGT